MEEIRRLFSPEKAYRSYRQHINLQTPPCIPYIGIYLTDLTFLQDGNPDMIDGLINVSKFYKISNVIMEMRHFQVPYSIPCDLAVLAQLQSGRLFEIEDETGKASITHLHLGLSSLSLSPSPSLPLSFSLSPSPPLSDESQ